jgi:hypothetical protein
VQHSACSLKFDVSTSSDYINEVLQESENDGDGTKSTSKEDWESAITFTAKTSRKCYCIIPVTCLGSFLSLQTHLYAFKFLVS